MTSHFTRSDSWVYLMAVRLALFWVLDIDVHTADLLLKNTHNTQNFYTA